MNYRFVLKKLGHILLIEALLLLAPLFVSVYYHENYLPFIYTILIILIIGSLLSLIRAKRSSYYAKEGILITTLSWVLVSIFGSLPFIFDGAIPSFVNAIFETISGFTTTGSSILTDVEALPNGLLFWRSFTHWIGGMGILVFVIAILPMSNDNSMHIVKAEVPGPFKGKLVPKLTDTAKWLYGIYMFLTIVEIVLLRLGGMPLLDSVLTSFGTAGTGGFGIKNISVAYYGSPYIEYVVGIFMLLFGINFNVFFFIIMRKLRLAFGNEELRSYLIIVIISVLLIALNILSITSGFSEAFRLSFFQVSSIITTTGYSTTDFNLWPTFSKIILTLLMFFGACGGSTCGGIKISRIVIAIKKIFVDLKRKIHPNAITNVRFENKKVEDNVVNGISNFIILYFVLIGLITLIVSLDNFDFETTLTSVISCLGNIGPGMGLVGPMGNFSMLSDLSKIVLSIAMLLGRLELYPIIVFLSPTLYIRNRRINKMRV